MLKSWNWKAATAAGVLAAGLVATPASAALIVGAFGLYGSAYTPTSGGPGAGGSSGTVGVPEPTTWAMMIFGFGGIGAMLRRRARSRLRPDRFRSSRPWGSAEGRPEGARWNAQMWRLRALS